MWGDLSSHGVSVGQIFIFDPVRDLVVVYMTTGIGVEAPWRDKRVNSVLMAVEEDFKRLGYVRRPPVRQ
jgi:hypothetical protein